VIKNERLDLFAETIIELRGADGKPKPMWQENKLGRFLLDVGIIGPHFPKIPFLLGSWGFSKVIREKV
jgi:hypothetical protein